MNHISSPYYNDDPFAILLDNPTPEHHSQSHNTSSQWMDARSDFSNWNTIAAESSHAQQNMSTEEDPSEESYHCKPAYEKHEDYPFYNNSKSPILYDLYIFPEPVYHGPLETYFEAPPKYQNAYNDIMVGLREPTPKYGYEHIMPSSPIECLDRSLRQTDEVTREKIMDKARNKFYGQQVYEYR
ncbi:hypothetical protein L1987_18422 [Smallanthus sonchifolius]|uniref:Uncharacterized protein n=1 Tax=Smallanthus sonchifolius TaxID=185202 RepID=A0ACB9J0R5_9ASTR|nr:hypothetical protein L1987_18422 [Smallanthus sonchifolius]